MAPLAPNDDRTYAALRGEAVLHDLTGQPSDGDAGPVREDAREIVVGTGADRVRFLHGIVTANVADTPIGGGCHAALLTPKAHLVADLRIFIRPDEIYLVVARGQGAAAAAALSRYAIMDDFAAAPAPELRLVALLGPSAAHRLAAIGYGVGDLGAFEERWSHRDVEGPLGRLWVVHAHQLGEEGYWLGASPPVLGAVVRALGEGGVPTLSAKAATAARVAAFEPLWGREITETHFPMEVGLGDTIDYKKGCFLGQEPIVRIRDRGHVNWRLAQLRLAGLEPPPLEAQLESPAKSKAGQLTTVADVPGEGPMALALVHVSVSVGDDLALVMPDGRRSVATVLRD